MGVGLARVRPVCDSPATGAMASLQKDSSTMIATLALLAACTGGPTTDFKGTGPMHEYFPYDGERHAVYYYAGVSSTDTGAVGIGYNLLVDKLEPVDEVDGVEIVTFTYTKQYTDGVTELL